MKFLHSEIGSAKDNNKSPVHNWYKFTAGFSHKFVDEIIQLQKLETTPKSKIFDPFAGCGTTLVSAQKAGIPAIGNEAQDFMFDVIRAKLNWKIKQAEVDMHMEGLMRFLSVKRKNYDLKKVAHPLLLSLYKPGILKDLYIIKDYLPKIKSKKYRLFFQLALSQTLHKVSIHPIAVPYISRNKTLSSNRSAWSVFSEIVSKMVDDSVLLYSKKLTSKIYKQDSRYRNQKIKTNSCTTCITSPPYLNNLDYGEVSKVHTHFFQITENWSDITHKVRRKLVTGATTHYIESEFSLSKFKLSTFYKNNVAIGNRLIRRYSQIKKISAIRTGKKSFHILMMLYFQDMYKVLREIKRVLKPNGTAYLILGDSAPYGVLVETTRLLGQIALNVGFQNYKVIKIRSRGSKWKDLKYRHNQELSENVLVLK
jgi:DNA modification methylase